HALTHGHHGKNTTVSRPSQLRAARNAPICRPEAVESEDMTTILCKIKAVARLLKVEPRALTGGNAVRLARRDEKHK
ncbi:hypothetical protein ABG768_013763, partial [Culter alburnus]